MSRLKEPEPGSRPPGLVCRAQTPTEELGPSSPQADEHLHKGFGNKGGTVKRLYQAFFWFD